MRRFLTPPFSPVLPWGISLLVLILLAFYFPTISRGITFSDGGEIATAIATLGVIHPTGYPIFTILAHWFVLLPTPWEAAIEISILNSILAVLASVFAALSTRELALAFDRKSAGTRWRTRFADAPAVPTAWLADATGVLGGLVLGLAPLLWHQVRIPEVYPLHVFLTSAAVFAWVRFEVTRDTKYVVWSAVPMGLGLAHHVTMAYALPAGAILLVIRRPRFFVDWLAYPVVAGLRVALRRSPAMKPMAFAGWWQFPLACLIGALPLLSYGYLIWATHNTSGIPWGGVDDWDALVNHATGRQYRHYMTGLDNPDVIKRLWYLPGVVEKEMLTFAGVAAIIGLLSVVVLAWPLGLYFIALGGSNITHALQYGVSDYKTYYLPALVVMSILFGLGAWIVIKLFYLRRSGMSLATFVTGHVALFGGLGGQLYYFGTRHAMDWLGQPTVLAVSIAFVASGVAWGSIQIVRSRLRHGRMRGLLFTTFPATIFGAVFCVFTLAGLVRAHEFAHMKVVGAKHASGVAFEVPHGGVYLTMGDGFLFSQWYYQHVMKEGHHSVVIKLRGPDQDWFRDRYMPSRFPRDCDPLWGKYAEDPAAFQQHCESFDDRMRLEKQSSWGKIMVGGYRHLPIRNVAEQKRFREEGPPVKRGNDPRCNGAAYRSKKNANCDCWNYYQRPYTLNEQCVHSFEDSGLAPAKKIDIYAHRVVQDHIEERPVYERNVFTDWGPASKNPREWDGPARLRPSAEYALVNRGRSNQVVWSKDIDGFDPCASENLHRLPVPQLSPRRERPLSWSERSPYRPNPWPVLLQSSYMTTAAGKTIDDSTLRFEPGQTIHLTLEWFERYHYDHEAKDRRGDAMTHGVRICMFDPDGTKVWTNALVTSGSSESTMEVPLTGAKTGRYTIQGCTVGELDTEVVPERLPCLRPILEFDAWVGTDPVKPGPLDQRIELLAPATRRG